MTALVPSAIICKGKANLLGQVLKKHGWYDGKYSISLVDDKLALPLTEQGRQQIQDLCQTDRYFTIDDLEFHIQSVVLKPSRRHCVKTKPERLLELSKQHVCGVGTEWSFTLQEEVPRSWEVHGNTALLPHNAYISHMWNHQGFWERVASCLGVSQLARKAAITDDDFRSPRVMFLLGNDPWLMQIDNGIKCTYNVMRSMFSSGNISEKLRMASFDCTNETVVDLYAGIGYFTLPYLVHARARQVHACEWNPAAVEALKRNLELNHCAERCTVYQGDNAEVCPRGIADRVNLGLIPSSERGWPVACEALRPEGGVLHIHANVTSMSNTKLQDLESNAEMNNADKHTVSNSVDTKDCLKPSADNTSVSKTKLVDSEPKGTSSDLDTITKLDPMKKNSNIFVESEVRMNDEMCTENDLNVNSNTNTCSNRTQNERKSPKECKHSGQKQNTKHEKKYMKFRKTCPTKAEWRQWGESTAETIKTLLYRAHPGLTWTIRIIHIEHVKSYAPYIDHIVLDLDCRRRGSGDGNKLKE